MTNPGVRLLDYAGATLARSAEVAALVNGGLAHIVEMDDLDRISVMHPGAVVIPAALAVAEREGASGSDFVAAVVAGYEVAIRIGTVVGKRHYYIFHNTATCGAFGAAAAAGWLLRLNEAQFVWALGSAGTQAAGLWEFNAEGAMSKHLHAGRAAANGVLAADLAARDFTGARRILEGERGFFAATAPDAEPARVLDDLNVAEPTFKISAVSIKPHASCRHTHPAVDAALALRSQLNGRVISGVQIETYQAVLDLCDNPAPETPYAVKFSLHYCVASALRRGRAGLVDFTPEAIGEPAVRELLPLVKIGVAPEFEARYPAEWCSRLQLTFTDGNGTAVATINHPKGDPENPLTAQELEDKFHRLAVYGGHATQATALLGWIVGLDAQQPIRPLTALSLRQSNRVPASG